MTNATTAKNFRSRLRTATRLGVACLCVSIVGGGGASAYIGESFVGIPDLVSGWKGKEYKNWLKVEAHYWGPDGSSGMFGGRRSRERMYFSFPSAPRKGESRLVISVDKGNPALRQIMDKCINKVAIPELTFAESSTRARAVTELGPRPTDIPQFFEYKLKDVRFSECPIVEDALEQAVVLTFSDIEWLNFKGDTQGRANMLQPARLEPIKVTGSTKSFVVSWFAVAHDISDDQCPQMNVKPSEEEYYALMSKEDAAKERAENAAKGGVSYQNGQMERRGPSKLNATRLPGIVKDPGHVVPQTKLARGLDLDGNDGSGKPPPGICKHKNYAAEDGRTGIDNQLYTVQGCNTGYMGHRGFYTQYANEQRRNGLLTTVVQISGIDDEKNDDRVYVTILHSKDPMPKNADGSKILADYTFRLTDNPEYTYFNTRIPGRIVNGIVITDKVDTFRMHTGLGVQLNMYQGRFRLQIMPDGSLKGILGGYEDWRDIIAVNANSVVELNYGISTPVMYNALKRHADGLKDPVTGQCNGISVAYDIEGSAAFIPPKQLRTLVAQGASNSQKVH